MSLDNSNKNNNNTEFNEWSAQIDQDEAFLPPDIRNEMPESFPRRRRHSRYKKKVSWIWVGVGAFVLVIILFAFFWEGQVAGPEIAEPAITEEGPPFIPPPGRSLVQDELNELYWVYQDFLPINRFSRPGTIITEINTIVIHNIGNPNTTAAQNRNFFANVAPEEEWSVSSNFIICLDGSIIQCVPVDEIAHASNQRNIDSLSIELCHPDYTGVFTEETYNAAVRLTAWLCVQFNINAEDIIRHFDVVRSDGSQKSCPRYFVYNEEAWEAFKAAVAIAMREFS